MSDNNGLEKQKQTVPQVLNDIASTGLGVWYKVEAEELGKVVSAATDLALEPGAGISRDSDELDQAVGMAVVEYLSQQVSNVFLEMEIYTMEIFHALMMVRMMCPEGVLINREANIHINLDAVLGLKQPERFAGLQRRMSEMLVQSALVEKLAAELTDLTTDKSFGGLKGTMPFTQDNARQMEKAVELQQADAKLREQLRELRAIIFETGEPVKLPDPPAMVPVESDMILAYCYVPEIQHLFIHWKKPGKGAPYGVYASVDADCAQQFIESPSKGKFIYNNLRDREDMPYKALETLPDIFGKS